MDVPDGTSTSTMVATPVDVSGTGGRRAWHRSGEHSEEILRSLGRSDGEIGALVAAGAVRLPSSR